METKKYLSLKETAELLGVKTATVRGWVRKGRFPRPDSKVNRKLQLWKYESVEIFIQSHSADIKGE